MPLAGGALWRSWSARLRLAMASLGLLRCCALRSSGAGGSGPAIIGLSSFWLRSWAALGLCAEKAPANAAARPRQTKQRHTKKTTTPPTIQAERLGLSFLELPFAT